MAFFEYVWRYYASLKYFPSLFQISLMNSLCIGLKRSETAFDPDKPIPTNPVKFSGTVFVEFQLVTEDFVKTVVQEMPQKSCDLDPMPTSVLYDCLDENIPTVTNIIKKSLSYGIVPQCYQHALVKPVLKKGQS